ncbi:unnamed protein product [Coregonus sp. 'balchen']|nr:unnamed protein product [Coregonus sp. 'balchen']
MYPENLKKEDLDQTELVNFIFCQIALACALPGSPKLVSLQKLQDLSRRFNRGGRHTPAASALFLLSILFWPEEPRNKEPDSANGQVLMSAIDALQRLCELKNKHLPPRKSRIVTHFFLGKARGLSRIVHRKISSGLVVRCSKPQKLCNCCNVLMDGQKIDNCWFKAHQGKQDQGHSSVQSLSAKCK